MIDVIPEWISQNGQQRQGANGLNVPGMRTGFPQPRSLMEREDVSLLLLNNLAFGEDPRVNELIQQALLPDMACNELVEYPFPTPPDEDIQGTINLGFCEETGAPAGIFPHEVHTLIVGASGKGKSTLNKHLIRQHIDNGIPVLIIDFENEYRELLNDERITVLGVDDLKWNPLEVPPGMDPVLYRQTLCSIFADQLGLLIASKTYLLDAVDKLYTLYGVYDGSGNFPSMYDLAELLRKLLEKYRATSRFTAYGEVCLNRAEGFILAASQILDCSTGMPLQLLTKGNVILQLSGVDHEYSSLLVTLILSWLCCYRIANG
ncbi:helicase HerA domain-containing protein, partial [Candidatus Poribacteria bacterium]